jgi:SAM-dependent methyltransferase
VISNGGHVTTSSINPGARQRRGLRSVRTSAAEAFRAVRKRHYRVAALGLVADAVNQVEERLGPRLGARFRCSCCGLEAHAFRHFASGRGIAWNSACPGCDSRSRHRGLAVLLPALVDERQPRRVLHFAPEAVLRQSFERAGLSYETADMFLEDVTHRGVDLQDQPFPDGSYDLVVCNHVLEHVPDDDRALRELARVLAPGGLAVITVPGDFTRAETIHFTGELENGHYRDYGLDLVDRLREVFGAVEVVDLHTLDRDENGLRRAIRPRDLAFLCSAR